MVHLKTAAENGQDHATSDNQLIRLESNQASQVPFPPGCPVIVLEDESLMYSGVVTAVYISFDHNTGLCMNHYRILSVDRKGEDSSEVVSGDRIRYAMNCPITVSSTADHVEDCDTVEGMIKGFELKSDDTDLKSSFPSFLYTVEVRAYSSDGEEQILRQRGISAKHVRFRPSDDTCTAGSSENAEERISVVSLDDEKNGITGSSSLMNIQSPIVKCSGTFSPPCKPTSMACTEDQNEVGSNMRSPGLVQDSNEGHDENYPKCSPLPTPYPTFFQGKLDPNAMIPDFSFLTNFSPGSDTPKGTKCCVMCGKIRQCNNGKSSKVKAMKSSESYSQESVVIPNQNKGICTLCDISVWVINKCGTQIKWCKGCKNFKAWCTFGTKGSATKCLPCRERQKEKYAAAKKRKIDSPQTFREAVAIERSFKRPAMFY